MNSCPTLQGISDILTWNPCACSPLVWRDAFESHLAKELGRILEHQNDEFLQQSFAVLPEARRRRLLRAPAVATMLRRHLGNQFDSRVFSELLLAELAAAGFVAKLPRPLWTSRGDSFLTEDDPQTWTKLGQTVSGTGISLDVASRFEFPDDEFGVTETVPYDVGELPFVQSRLSAAIEALQKNCPKAFELVSTVIEVLALRREPESAGNFYSSTFPGCPGLVRFTNVHLPSVNVVTVIEGFVHEAIHCILHMNEELYQPFVVREDASHMEIRSPWTGASIRLQSYIHACGVWYGLYWLWSTEKLCVGAESQQVDGLRTRAAAGFRTRPVTNGLASVRNLMTEDVYAFVHELEQRMLMELHSRRHSDAPRNSLAN